MWLIYRCFVLYKNWTKKEICKYSQFRGENVKILRFFLPKPHEIHWNLLFPFSTITVNNWSWKNDHIGSNLKKKRFFYSRVCATGTWKFTDLNICFFYYHLICFEIVWNLYYLHCSWQFCMPWYAFVLSLEIFLMNWKI